MTTGLLQDRIGHAAEPTRERDAITTATERMLPELSDAATFWEHIYRYRFATRFVRNKRVLDVACGDGYGTRALLQAGAASAIGVDISQETCSAARAKHGIDARPGDAQDMPLPDHSADVVVSFETIEHVEDPERFLDEVLRVLTPQGTLIISTPDKTVYAESGRSNPFHFSEMSRREFFSLLERRFGRVSKYLQRPKTAAWWSPLSWVSDDSPWADVNGFWRMRQLLCPQICGEVADRFRASPVDAILMRQRPLAGFVNPFEVRSERWLRCTCARYLIAVARSPKLS